MAWALPVWVFWACGHSEEGPSGGPSAVSEPPETPADETAAAVGNGVLRPESAEDTERYARARRRMVEEQIEARGVEDARVLDALRSVPRHRFVPEGAERAAYGDSPLRIGHGQTISQPYIVAAMTELAQLPEEGCRVLEVGTGSGYQAAVLSAMGCEVWTIEIVEPLARQSAALLQALEYEPMHTRTGDGYQGWPEAAPFDAILVTAAPPEVPEPLKEQLKVGGRLVIPVGEYRQELRVIERTDTGFEERGVFPVRFVPMTGRAQE